MLYKMKITTNHQWREFISHEDVPPTVLEEEFRHIWDLSGKEIYRSDYYLKYKGEYYHLSDFMRNPHGNWQGVLNFDAWCGLLVESKKDRYKIAFFSHVSNVDEVKDE